jgi:hypothetical protein
MATHAVVKFSANNRFLDAPSHAGFVGKISAIGEPRVNQAPEISPRIARMLAEDTNGCMLLAFS